MGEVSQPGIVGTGTGVTPIFISGDGECEDRTVIWKIKNFSEFLEMPKEEWAKNGLSLEAGNCVLSDGTPSRAIWTYYFQTSKADDVDWVGGYLHLLLGKSKEKSARAAYSATLCSGGKRIKSVTVERKQFSTTDGGSPAWGYEKLMKKSELLEKTKGTNELEITINVKAFSNYDFKPVLQESPSPSSSELMQMRGQANSDFGNLLETEDGADIVIKVPRKVGGELNAASYSRKAHQAILVARSPVFSKMFGKGAEVKQGGRRGRRGKEGWVEGQNGEVVIKDLSPKGLDVFLRYLYTGEVLEEWVQVFPEIINAADKYDCGQLKQYCGHNLLPAVTTGNALKMLKLAKLHSLSFAVKGIMEFIHKNSKAVFTEAVIDQVPVADE